MTSVAQETLVLRVPTAEHGPLQERVAAGRFEFRPVPHAVFSAKGEGVVATLYRSGKLVVQGADPAAFAVRYGLEGEQESKKAAGRPAELDGVALVGSDESGKGDVFGPLVVASVRVEAGDAARMREGGIGDSKAIADGTILRLAPALREHFPHAVTVLDPPEYNAEHARQGNLNPLLADLHAATIRRVAVPGVPVLVDRFANERLLAERLADLDAPLLQRTKAEREMAVAAASVLAREAFLVRLAELSEAFAVDLPKGAGDPVDRALARFPRHPSGRGPRRRGEDALQERASRARGGVSVIAAILSANGNGLAVVDGFSGDPPGDPAALAREVCGPRDGRQAIVSLVVIGSPRDRGDCRMRVFHRDGSRCAVSGSALFCAAKFVLDRQLVTGAELSVETDVGHRRVRALRADGRVTEVQCDMGTPEILGARVVLDLGEEEPDRVEATLVHTGNAYAVVFVEDVQAIDVPSLGAAVERHPAAGVASVVFASLRGSALAARAWERGGEPASSCNGAVAVAAAGIRLGLVVSPVWVEFPGGTPEVEWPSFGSASLTGSVEEIE